MGLTYTFCYCIRPARKCKSRFGEKKEEVIDQEHWLETRENLSRYLADEVCVPDASESIEVPVDAIRLLEDYAVWIRSVDDIDTSDATCCLEALSKGNEIASRIAYLAHRLAATPVDSGVLKTSTTLKQLTSDPLNLPAAKETDGLYLEVSDLLVRGLHRAFFELLESKRNGSQAYVFHHLALVVDGVSELFRLTTEAIGHIGTERLLGTEHRHLQALERRWEEDGV